MNILITGAFGFVGTNLSKQLSKNKNNHLIALDVNAPENHFYNEIFTWNELDQLKLIQIDAIIHLAGKAHDTKNVTEEKAYFDINVGLTKEIFAFFKVGGNKICFFQLGKSSRR